MASLDRLLALAPDPVTLLSWLATCAVHSTVLILLVLLLTRLVHGLRNSTREVLWRCALFGSPLTATLQLWVGLNTVSWHLPAPPPFAATVVDLAALDDPLEELSVGLRGLTRQETETRRDQTGRRSDAHGSGVRNRAPDRDPGSPALLGSRRAPGRDDRAHRRSLLDRAFFLPGRYARFFLTERLGSLSGPALSLLIPLWLVGSAFVWLGSVLASVGLRLRLARRQAPRNPQLAQAVATLGRRAGLQRRIRVSVSSEIQVPVAFGILRPEICLPARAFTDLDADQRHSMLAHEVGHLARMDPLWLLLIRSARSLLFFQPLLRPVVRELRSLAEQQCDDLAVRLTGNRLSLASCLAEVAGWRLSQRHADTIPAMAGSASALGQRIERLLDRAAVPQEMPCRSLRGRLLVVALLGLTVAVPGLSAARSAPRTATPTESDLGPARRPPAREAVWTALDAVCGELDELRAEVDALRRDALGGPPDPEVAAALHSLTQRQKTIQELVFRLEAWTGRAPGPGAPSPGPSPEHSLIPATERQSR